MEQEQAEQQQMLLPQERKKMRAMVAVDDSEESFYALNWVLDKIFSNIIMSTLPTGTETPDHQHDHRVESNLVSVVHVMDRLPHYVFQGGNVVESATKAREQNAAKILSQASQMCKDRKVAAETLILEGDPKEVICEAVERMHVDVLVVDQEGIPGKCLRLLCSPCQMSCCDCEAAPQVVVAAIPGNVCNMPISLNMKSLRYRSIFLMSSLIVCL